MFLSQDAALPVKQKQSFAESFKSLLKSVSHIYGESFISTHIIQYLYKMAERESKDCNPLIHWHFANFFFIHWFIDYWLI